MIAALRTLRHPPFRRYFVGQGLSLIGTWMQSLATSWLVYRLSGSALLLGLTATLQQLPMLLVSPLVGVWAERVDRRRALIVIQSIAIVFALALAALTFTGFVTVAQVIALSVAMGIVNAIENPMRQAFLIELVPSRADLPNAIALQATMFHSARFIGPMLAGVVLAAAGEAWCFLINAGSFVAVVIAYASLRTTSPPAPPEAGDWWAQLRAGFRYAFGFVGTRRILVLLGVVSFFSHPWATLMPIFAAEVFSGNSRTLGTLSSAVGLGAVAGSVVLAARSSVRGLGRVIAGCVILAGFGLASFAVSRELWIGLALLAVFGFGLIVAVAAGNTILQIIADEDKRARVISIHVMVFLGIGPTGSILAGAVAERFGAPLTLAACGAVVAMAGMVFAAQLKSWARAVRPVYDRLGISARR